MSVNLMHIEIPVDTLVAFKIWPGDRPLTDHTSLHGQSGADWSALYAQFNVKHAVAYLPNHFDRGHEHAMLISITTKKPIHCYVYHDKLFTDTKISSADKAGLLRKSINELISVDGNAPLDTSKPLLQAIGEDLNSFVVMFDAEDLECAFPHCLLNSDNFSFTTHVVFTRDPVRTYLVLSAVYNTPEFVSNITNKNTDNNTNNSSQEYSDIDIINASDGSSASAMTVGHRAATTLKLAKGEKEDMSLLASHIEPLIPGKCEWILSYVNI